MSVFEEFFKGKRLEFLKKAIKMALDEDGEDITSKALFPVKQKAEARIIAKEDVLIAGLPIIPLIFNTIGSFCELICMAEDGDFVKEGAEVARIKSYVLDILKAERVILNFLCHLSGIATLTHRFVKIASKYEVDVLDTRKTLPGLRYPEKYAVLMGGGKNHRFGLDDMIMIKDTHIDFMGSIEKALKKVMRFSNSNGLIKVVVECRSLEEVKEAVKFKVHRIMLDNMDVEMAKKAISLIPDGIEVEISGGVDLSNLEDYARLKPDFISVGRIIHSAKYADLSMRLNLK